MVCHRLPSMPSWICSGCALEGRRTCTTAAFCSKLTTSAKRATGPALWMQWTKAAWSHDGGSFWVLRCSAATTVASSHMPVSLACFGSGLFNELGKHMTNWRQREREREGREEKRVCGGNHMVSHTSKAVSTHKVQAPSTPQHRLPI